MNTEQFFSMILPASGTKCLAVKTPTGMRHRWFTDLHQMAQVMQQLSHANYEVYYGLSGFVPDETSKFRRLADQAKFVKSFWADIDVGPNKPYTTQLEAVQAVATMCKTYEIPKPVLVNSGYGVHAYWPLPSEISTAAWTPLASTLKQLLPALGLQIGVERTGDSASILRPVGAANYKRTEPAPVSLLWAPAEMKGRARKFIQAVQFQAQARNITPNITASVRSAPLALNRALGAIYEERPVNAAKLAERCAWLRNAHDHPASISEPEWYAMLNILKFTETPEPTAQAWSQGHPGYSEQNTTAKLDHAIASGAGPSLCSTLEGYKPELCSGCPHHGKIKTPLVLGRVAPEPAQPPAPDATDVMNGYAHRVIQQPAPPYRIDEYGSIWRDGEDPFRLYAYPIMLTARCRDKDGREYYTFSVGREDKTWVDFDIKAADLASQTDCVKAFAAVGVNGFPHGELMHYVRSFAEDMKSRQQAAGIYERLGWQTDQSFVGPEGRYQEGQEPEPVLFTPSASTILRHIRSNGSLEKWKEVTKNLGRSPSHAMGFLMGFAAPLVQLSGYNGFLVNLYGGTGVGKSAVQEAAATIYGPWNHLHLRAVDTVNSTFTMAGTLSALPVLIEEITTMRDHDLASLVYSATEGRPKRRAQRDGALVESSLEWATTFVTSTNRSIADMIPSGQAVTQEALLARVLEVELLPPSNSETDNGELLVKHLRDVHLQCRENYGHAGPIWLNYVVHNAHILTQEIQQFQDAVALQWGVDRTAGRFWLAATALALVAAKHTAKLGLFEIPDLTEFKEWLRLQYGAMSDLSKEVAVNLSERLNFFLDEHLDHTLTVRGADTNWSLVGGIPMQGKAVYVRQEVDEIGNMNTIYVSTAAIRDWCIRKQYSYTELRKWMAEQGLLMRTASVRMERGAIIDNGQRKIACLALDGAHPLFRTLTIVKNDVEATRAAG